ncbi:IS3 family transposase [Micromonospora sp. NPDC049230]|uniref:IS3 family transposase n=1 Tax=Micromonospora sp. NPDC049230 TaxID=3155502 RepID=UPI00340E4CBC
MRLKSGLLGAAAAAMTLAATLDGAPEPIGTPPAGGTYGCPSISPPGIHLRHGAGHPRLRVLNIGATTYYAWVKQAEQPCDRDVVDLGPVSNIHESWETSGRTYGADRGHRQLRRDGIRVGRKRVERLMAQQGWQGAFLRRGWRGGSTRQDPRHTPAPDLVNRQFTADGPNRLWVADATRIPCGEGVFWLAAVRDVFSRRIVGWKTSDRCDTDLILAALEYGIWSRDVRDGQLIHHSDRGSTYTSFRFSERSQDNGILPSMGSVGDSYDNALMENFWSTLKIELVYRTVADPRRGREPPLHQAGGTQLR